MQKPLSFLYFVVFALFTLAITSCSNQGEPELPPFEPATFADSVAAAHGFGEWSKVEQLDFDFVVEVSDTQRVSRSWSWFPKTDSVVRRIEGTEMGYVRNTTLSEPATEADQQFINDSYWLLMPFYLEWSKDGYTSEVTRGAQAPLSGTPATKLTVMYNADAGYTPGDAYDLYIGDDYQIKEWVFRRQAAAEPTMTMAWVGYETVGGLVLPTDHPGDGPVRIRHPELNVETGS